jgi:tRNA-dihydrouridine synthase 3
VEPEKAFTLNRSIASLPAKSKPKPAAVASEEEAANETVVAPEEEALNAGSTESKGVVDGEAEVIDVPLRPEEKRRLNWENGIYLAPLTTVGNLVSL